jgi:hypothetical protein
LQEDIAGGHCRRILQEDIAGGHCRRILQDDIAGGYCKRVLQELLLLKNIAGRYWRRRSGKRLTTCAEYICTGSYLSYIN